MADYQIFTPPREPTAEELENNMVFTAPGGTEGTVSARIMYLAGSIAVQLFFADPIISVRYEFSSKKWLTNSGDPIDITTVDLTIPKEIVSSATVRTSFFDLMAFEKGTTACKLAAVEDAKLLIKNSIINKGVEVPEETKFREYAEKISKIPSGSSVENVTGQLTGLRRLAISARYVLNGEVKITETESTETIQVQKNSLIFVTHDSPVTLSGLIEDVYSPGTNLKLCFVTGDFSVSM